MWYYISDGGGLMEEVMTGSAVPGTVPAGAAAERAAAMVALHRGGWTLQQIGDRYGVTRERVRQILKGEGAAAAGGGAAARRRASVDAAAAEIRSWLQLRGPVALSELYRVFSSEPWSLPVPVIREAVADPSVPRALVLRGASPPRGPKLVPGTFDGAAAVVAEVWAAAGRPTDGFSKKEYDAARPAGVPASSSLAVRWRWSELCAAAGVPANRARRSEYRPRWTDEELRDWFGRYVADAAASGGWVSFTGYTAWAADRPGAPSISTIRNRLRDAVPGGAPFLEALTVLSSGFSSGPSGTSGGREGAA
jgi:hypothetical protein